MSVMGTRQRPVRPAHRWPVAGAGALAVALLITGCGTGDEVTAPASTHQPVTNHPAPPTTDRDIMHLPHFAPLDPGTYSIDPDDDPATQLRVLYTVPADGWVQWIGAAKSSDNGLVAVSITTVTNVVRDGCSDHSWADPPIGPSVDDLAAALTSLAPFRVTSTPTDVSIYGYPGVHLQWTVPNLPFEGEGGDGTFMECVGGQLKSWVAAVDTAPGDAFYGYTGPGYTEEFWILDVDGNRLMIAAEWSLDSPAEDIEELRTILHSIRIQPGPRTSRPAAPHGSAEL
jgi:hypothetical protein